MLKRPPWFMVLVVGAFALVIAGTTVYLLRPPHQTGDVAVPPLDAGPERVVTAYIDALTAHDCHTAESLMVVGAQDTAVQWCKDVGSLMHVKVHDHLTEPPSATGNSAPEEVANVPVTFDLKWRPFHSDGSMEEGVTDWGYLLVRESADSPWRIFDQGTG